MIRKTQKIFKRRVQNKSWWPTIQNKVWCAGDHTEVVARNTWWLLWVIPLYVRETIVGHDLTL